jgi:NAD(P)-dependent dehydrogenase (short-subunit alcohol dehydrogenase family)
MMNIKLKPLNQQVAVVIGASSGMGRATAQMLAERGAKVVVAARGEDGLRSLVEEICAKGGEAVYQTADVSDFEQVKAVANLAIQTYGRIDTWVGVAGVWITSKFSETKPEELRRILDVNLMGQAHGIWAALPHLKRNAENGGVGGALILFSSVLGQIGLPLTSAYCASKHGLNGLLDTLRVELIQDNLPISVTTVMPFGTNTPIYETGLTRLGFMPRPAPPIMQPEVVAEAVVYAAENPIRQVYGSGGAKAFALANQLMPELMDQVLAQLATAQNQSTEVPRSEDAPHGLYEAVPNFNVHGYFDNESVSRSPYVDLQTQHANADGLSEISAALQSIASNDLAQQSQYEVQAIQQFIEALIMQQNKVRVS